MHFPCNNTENVSVMMQNTSSPVFSKIDEKHFEIGISCIGTG